MLYLKTILTRAGGLPSDRPSDPTAIRPYAIRPELRPYVHTAILVLNRCRMAVFIWPSGLMTGRLDFWIRPPALILTLFHAEKHHKCVESEDFLVYRTYPNFKPRLPKHNTHTSSFLLFDVLLASGLKKTTSIIKIPWQLLPSF